MKSSGVKYKNPEDIEAKKQEEWELIVKVMNGNQQAFAKLQNRYQRIIASLIRRMIKDESDVEDLTQETFIKAFRGIKTFQKGFTFSSWLYKIASNNCIDFIRKKKMASISINQSFNSEDPDREFDIEDKTETPEAQIVSKERNNKLNEAIDNLPEKYRIIIRMRHEEDLDYQQISDLLEIPLGTVKANLFRARKLLLTSLQHHRYLFSDN